jgi:hypothetical protein
MSGIFTHFLHQSDITKGKPPSSGFLFSFRVMGVTGFWGQFMPSSDFCQLFLQTVGESAMPASARPLT